MSAATPPPSVNTKSLPAPPSLINSPVTSIPFIRRLFVTDPSTLPSSHPSAASAQPKPFRRHSFDLGTVIWTEHSFTSAATPPAAGNASPSPASHSASSTPTHLGRPLAHVTAGHSLPSAVNAADIAAGSAGAQKAAPKLLERLCRQEWDFS